MSVSAGNREIFYDADGVETEFDFTFDVTDSDDVSVSVVADGVESVVDPGDYTIALTARDETEAYYPGGTVTFDTAPADGGRVRIYGDADIENNMNLTANESVFRSSLQRFVDRAYWVAQELKRDLARKFGFQDPEESAFEFPASDEAGYWYSDGAGNISLVETVDSGDLTVGGDTAGYVPFWSAAMTLTGVVNFFYTLATKTLRLRGSTTASDHTLKLQNSAGTDVGTFRSDGVPTASTDLVTKATTDAISTQLDSKVGAASPSFTGTLTVTQGTAGNAVQVLQSTHADGNPGETVYQNTYEGSGSGLVTILTIPIPTDTSVIIDAVVIAKQIAGVGANDSEACWGKCVARNVSGTVTVRGTPDIGDTGDSGVFTGGDKPTFTVSSTNIRVQVQLNTANARNVRATARVYPCG